MSSGLGDIDDAIGGGSLLVFAVANLGEHGEGMGKLRHHYHAFFLGRHILTSGFRLSDLCDGSSIALTSSSAMSMSSDEGVVLTED
jgi:hypothetical protein